MFVRNYFKYFTGEWGKEGHGCHQAGIGHGAAGKGGDRGVERVCGQIRGADPPQEVEALGAGSRCMSMFIFLNDCSLFHITLYIM